MAKTSIHVGLEIGTQSTRMIVGEVAANDSMTIIGIGEVPSEGVVRGEIHDSAKVSQCVYDAWCKAQDHSDVDIVAVYLAVTGKHIYGENNNGTFRLPKGETVISRAHMNEVCKIAKDLPIAMDRCYLHRVIGNYTLDGQVKHSSPENELAETLDVHCHIIHGTENLINKANRCVKDVPLSLNDVVFSPLAASLTLLKREDKMAGSLVIDMGAGTTDFVLYVDGDLVASGCVPLGGDHISNDIHLLFDVPLAQAELLKKTEGDANGFIGKSNEVVRMNGDGRMRDIAVNRAELNRIIRDRIEEIFNLVRKSLPEGTFEKRQCRTVYLCGGGSLMRGIGELAKQIFGVNIILPSSEAEKSSVYFDNPRYTTVIGLLRYAQIVHDENVISRKETSLFRKILSIFGKN